MKHNRHADTARPVDAPARCKRPNHHAAVRHRARRPAQHRATWLLDGVEAA